MSFWNSTQIISINDGAIANDGTGDPIRDAFIKVNENFANISYFLAQPTIDFLYANIEQTLRVNYIESNIVYSGEIIGNTAYYTSNVSIGNLTSNYSSYNLGTTINYGNTYVGNINVSGTPTFTGGNVNVSTNILPTANLTYDLGGPTNFFRNIYAQGVVNVNTVSTSSDAGLLKLHANLTPGDVKDVGIFGKYYDSGMGSNAYAFFGLQDSTKNFVYKQTYTDATAGNSVVYDGVYGNVQFGSQYLSNTTNSTSTTTGALIVAGGAGVAGNVYASTFYGNLDTPSATVGNMVVTGNIDNSLKVTGNIYAGGYQVLTTNSPGLQLYVGTSLFSGNMVVSSVTPSVDPGTGAVVLNTGGLGVAGNINAGGNVAATGLVGPLYGTVMTSAQPYITSLGSLPTLNVGSLSATSIGVTNLTATTSVNFTGVTLTGLASVSTSGNVTAANVSAYQVTGQLLQGTLIQPVQTNITSLGTLSVLTVSGLATIGNITTYSVNAPFIGNSGTLLTGTLSTTAQPYVTSLGTLSGLNVSGLANFASGITTSTVSAGTVGNTGTVLTGTLSTAAQPNITSLGILSGLNVSGSANFASGITTSTVSAGTIGNTGSVLTGTLSTAAQPNITSLGIIANLSASVAQLGTVQIVNFSTANAQITGGSITGTVISGLSGSFANINSTGNVAVSSTIYGQGIYDDSNRVVSLSSGSGNLTISGASIALTATGPGAVTIGGSTAIPVITTDQYGRISALSSASISTTLSTAGNSGTGSVALASQTLNIVGGTDISTTDSAQTITINDTSTLQSVTGRGATTSNPVTFTGQINLGADIIPTANAVYNLGSTTAWFNQFYGVATHAYYADLAERYVADSEYVPGTVVVFGGAEEITVTSQFADARVAGAISTDPAYLMNAMSPGLPVALRGKIPVQVVGPVNKGDSLVTAGNMPGYAVSVGTNITYGQAVFAKSLTTDLSDGVKTIIAVII